MFRFLPMGCVLLMLSVATVFGADTSEVVLQAGDLQARLSTADGQVQSVSVRGNELLAGPGSLSVQVDKEEPAPMSPKWERFSVKEEGEAWVVTGREPESGIEVKAVWRGGRDIECRVTLVQPGPERLKPRWNCRSPALPNRSCGWRRPVANRRRSTSRNGREWAFVATWVAWSCRPCFSISRRKTGG